MTNNRRRTARSLTTGDIVILTIVIGVFLGASILGGAVLWNELNPSKWTAAGWAAVGAWVAGFATFLAASVALLESHRARKSAESALQQEYWRVDIGTSLRVLDTLRSLVRYMDHDLNGVIVGYRGEWDSAQEAEYGGPDETSPFWAYHWGKLNSVHTAVQDYRAEIETAGLSIRTPGLREALNTALSTTGVIEKQLNKWLSDIAIEDQINTVLGEVDEITKNQDLDDIDKSPERVLSICARHAQRTMLDAAKFSEVVNPWRT